MTPSSITARRSAARADEAPNRVAPPSASFWAVKILTTGMGETISDFLVRRFAPELAVPLAFAVLVVALVVQIRLRRYRPAVYWTTALMVSVVGTMAADVLHVGLGVPYIVSTAGFAVVLAVVFLVWKRVEGTLSVHEIRSARRECFYWAAVVTTFALGTAAGDLTATALGLGFWRSAVLFALAFAVPGVLWAVTRRGAVLLFWTAYVLTRPFGASVADALAVPPARGGLGLGTGPVSAVLLGVFVVAVILISLRGRRSGSTRHP